MKAFSSGISKGKVTNLEFPLEEGGRGGGWVRKIYPSTPFLCLVFFWNSPIRHGVTRKRRELNDKKDIIKLFRKNPQQKGVN